MIGHSLLRYRLAYPGEDVRRCAPVPRCLLDGRQKGLGGLCFTALTTERPMAAAEYRRIATGSRALAARLMEASFRGTAQ